MPTAAIKKEMPISLNSSCNSSQVTAATLWNLTVTALARLDLLISLAAPLCRVTCVPSSRQPGAMQLDVRFASIAETEQRHFPLARYGKNV